MTVKLRNLYTDHVVPDDLMALWNNGLGRVSHIIRADQDPVAERHRVATSMVKLLVAKLLRVDSSPTLSRFFTFRCCTDAMHTMVLLGLPPHAFRLKTTARKENQKRLTIVMKFFRHEEALHLLQRVSLSFQLTGKVEAMVSTSPAANKPPPMVLLCRGDAARLVKDQHQKILRSIASSDDPTLNIEAATGVLLAVAMELIIRLAKLAGYPAALCKMSKRWFPDREAALHVHEFLKTDPDQLDVGVGLQLHKLAWSSGNKTEIAAAAWLQSPHVQELLDKLAEVLLTHSLDVERRHAEVKQWEASKLSHIATVSRNAMTTRYLRWRNEMVDALQHHTRSVRRSVRTNIQALGWQQPATVRPVGVRWSATRQPDADADTSEPPASSAKRSSEPPASSAKRSGQAQASSASSSTAASSREVDLVEQKASLVANARAGFDNLLHSLCVPVTRTQWEDWLSDNIVEFRETMASVQQLRRQHSHRLRARGGLPPAVFRIQPLAIKDRVDSLDWACKLQHRTGWHVLKTRDHGVIVVFLMHLWRRTHYVQLRVTCKKPPQFTLETDFDISKSVAELGRLAAMLADDDVLQMFEFKVSGATVQSRGVCLTVGVMRPITECVPVPRKTPEAAEEGSDDDGDVVVLGSDVEGDVQPVVDTDEESDAGSTVGSETSSEASIAEEKAKAMTMFLNIPPVPSVARKLQATGEKAAERSGLPALWSDEYFWIRDVPGELLFVRVRVAAKKPWAAQHR